MASLLSHSTSMSSLLVLFATSYLNTCGGIFTQNRYISTDEDPTRPETIILQGTVRGRNLVTHHNRTVFGFLGIPYAEPPVGNLRFAAPVPPGAWDGTLDASGDTIPCSQVTSKWVHAGIEDCLYLNVYTPQLSTSDNSMLMPVMVYIVGGVFMSENNSLIGNGPDLLLDEDVLLVVPNFRVGVLGFLSTGDEVAPGNYGLKDIVRALEWVQENIRYFGGDPNRVTLLGGSSGASCVHLLTLSDSTNGLFHRYLTQSGSAHAIYLQLPKEKYAKRATQLGEYLKCPTNTSILLINCLRVLNVSQLTEAFSIFHVWNREPSFIWHPITEPDIEGALFTDSPANLIASGKIRDLPWISSVNRDEGLYFSMQLNQHSDLFEDFLDKIDLVLPQVLGYDGVVDDTTSFTAALKAYYLNDLTADRSILLNNVTELVSDGIFIYPAHKAIQQQLIYAKNPLYFGFFAYRGTFSHTYPLSGGSTNYTSVSHGDETIYLFETYDSRFGPPNYKNSESDWKMVKTMVQLWTSFATNGTPTTTGLNTTTVWEPYSSRKNYLRIGNGPNVTLEMKYDLFKERMEFWDKLNAGKSDGFRNLLQIMPVALCLHLLLYVRLF